MRASGAIEGSELPVAGGAFAAGDQVVIKRNDSRLGVTNGERGRVRSVDPAAQQLVVELGGGAVTLDPTYLNTPTDHGDPSLTHGYAITCHVAQGRTVDRTFVLADAGLNRELAYTALSRGRISNHVYLARELDDARAEYAPAGAFRADPVERLTAALSTTRASVLAIDSGRDDASSQLAQARHELAAARTDRAELDRRWWRPGRRADLTLARAREITGDENLARLNLRAAEKQHAQRPFVAENDLADRADALRDRLINRRHTRSQDRGLER